MVQSIIGINQEHKANKKLQSFFRQRKAFSTPSEIFDMLNLSQLNASQGFSDQTLQYLTGQAGSGMAKTLGVAERLGADPNDLSSVLDSYFQDIFKIGSENDLLKMQKFDRFSNALQVVASNKEAEWQSRENILKDQMQAEAQKVAAAQANVQSGLNLTLAGLSSLGSSDLYGDTKGKRGSKSKSTTGGVYSGGEYVGE